MAGPTGGTSGAPSAGAGGNAAGGGGSLSGSGGVASGGGGDAPGGAGGEAGGITVEPVTGRIALAYGNACVQKRWQRVLLGLESYVDVLLTAPGDCYEPTGSAEGIQWEFPSPSNTCD
jgi:hypothetical protein